MLDNLSLLDLFLRAALLIANKFVVILIVLSGYIFLKKDVFGRTFIIFAFAMILNPFVKSLFQIPLPPASGLIGWGFPSGHMFAATIFWGWLCWEHKNKYLYIITCFLLGFMSIALVHFNYHYPLDVAGAFFFAILTMVLFYQFLKFPLFKYNSPLSGFILCLIGLILIYFTPNITKDSFNWVALISLLGFTLGWFLSNKFSLDNNLSSKIKVSIFLFSILGLVVLESIFFLTHTQLWFIKLIHYFIIALWLTLLAQTVVVSFIKRKQAICIP